MRVIEFEDFVELPEGIIFSYYFPYLGTGSPHADPRPEPPVEGLYVKGKTYNSSRSSEKPFPVHPLLPEVHEYYEELKDDETLPGFWEEQGAEFPDLGYWGSEGRSHYYVVYEEDDLRKLIEAARMAAEAVHNQFDDPGSKMRQRWESRGEI